MRTINSSSFTSLTIGSVVSVYGCGNVIVSAVAADCVLATGDLGFEVRIRASGADLWSSGRPLGQRMPLSCLEVVGQVPEAVAMAA